LKRLERWIGKSYRRYFPDAWPRLSSRHLRLAHPATSLYQPLQSTPPPIHLRLITPRGTHLSTRQDEASRRSNASMVLVSLPKLSASLPWPRHLSWRNSSELQLINFCSIVLSVFAIVILSVIGALFKSNHHSMMGSTEDPKDGPAVAATVFSAVIVYVVRTFLHYLHSPLAFTHCIDHTYPSSLASDSYSTILNTC